MNNPELSIEELNLFKSKISSIIEEESIPYLKGEINSIEYQKRILIKYGESIAKMIVDKTVASCIEEILRNKLKNDK